ncbi:MAG: hypothetical protein D6722_18365 [Bacteroidetes bacterium]|nr:MAG: hypothetical protein D6722_18365 [Bacteroidota bacterium]
MPAETFFPCLCSIPETLFGMIVSLFRNRIWIVGLLIGWGLLPQVQAQRAAFRPLQHELALQLGSANLEPAYLGQYAGLPLSLTPANGLRYKYALHMTSRLRAGLRYTQARYEAEPDAFNIYRPGQRREMLLQAGYEKVWYQGIQRFFVGADALVSRGQMEDQGSPLVLPDRYQARYTYTGYGLGAVLGYSLSLGPRLLLTLEAMPFFQRYNYGNTSAQPEPELPGYVRPAQRLGLDVAVYLGFQGGKRASKKCACPGI